MMRRATRRSLDAALDGIENALGGEETLSAGAPRPEPRRDSTWWGWGRTDSRPELSEAARALLARELGELESDEPGSSWPTSSCRRPKSFPTG